MEFYAYAENKPHQGVVHLFAEVYDGGATIDSVRRIKIKRREYNSQSYITLAFMEHWNQHPVYRPNIEYDDFLTRNNTTYIYLFEFIDNRSGQDIVLHTEERQATSQFNLLVIADYNTWYRTPLNVSAINTTLIRPYSTNVPMYTQKPSYYCNTAVSYEEGTAKGIWLEMFECPHYFIPNLWESDFIRVNNYKYRRRFKDWLAKGNAKILKNIMGEMWMVGIKTDSITDNSLFDNAEIEGARQIEFGWFEIGDPENEKDLYYNGLINVSSDDWSGQ